MFEVIPLAALESNYIWLIKNQSHVVIVDPGEADKLIAMLETNQLKPLAIIITHHHWDHVNGLETLSKHYDELPIYTPERETIGYSTVKIKDDDHIHIPELDLKLQVMEVPGHTLGAVSYYNEHLVFTGDTLFAAGCGRLFEGTATQMYHSLTRLQALPDTTAVYCGHEYTVKNLQFAHQVEPHNPNIQKQLEQAQTMRAQGKATLPSTISQEKNTNPFLRTTEQSVIEGASNYAGRKLSAGIETFTILRQWKDVF